MKSHKDIEDRVAQFSVNPRKEMRNWVLDKALGIQESERQRSTSDKFRWRKIMRSPISKLAVAAVVIIAVVLGIDHFGGSIGGTSVAWAKVAEKIDRLPAFSSREKRIATSDGKEIAFLRSDVAAYYSPEYGMREDMYNEKGHLLHQVYTLWAEKKTITIQPALKQYRVVGLDSGKIEQFRANLKRLVRPIESGEYAELGRREIDGVEVEGIEISDPNIMAGVAYPVKFDSLVIRLWAEVETSLLYRIEGEATTSDKYVTQFTGGKPVEIKVVTKGYEWDAELEKSVFEPNIQDDYTLLPE